MIDVKSAAQHCPVSGWLQPHPRHAQMTEKKAHDNLPGTDSTKPASPPITLAAAAQGDGDAAAQPSDSAPIQHELPRAQGEAEKVRGGEL